MRLTPPKKTTFWVAVILAVVGLIVFLLGYLGVIGLAWIGLAGFILLALAFILLVLGLLIKGF